jgi:glycosyltransferase involved in cell wall biosynthesis
MGFLGTALGLGEGARLMVHSLRAAGLDVQTANVSPCIGRENFEAGDSWPADATAGGSVIVHVNPDVYDEVVTAIGAEKLRERRIIAYWLWELEVVPPKWVKTLEAVDEVWSPSQFTASAFRKVAGRKRVHVVPYCMDISNIRLEPLEDPFPQFRGRPIVFFSYDVRSTHARKNPEAVIAAFRSATAGNPEPVLILKVHGEEAWPEAIERLEYAASGHPGIHILRKTFSLEAMRDVLARVDIVMSLHRSEGFGLLMAEAMGAAKPVIATGWSANVDFMSPACSVLVDYKLTPVVDPQNFYDQFGARWAEPDIEHAAAALRHLLNDPAERQRMGNAARAHMLQYCDSEKWVSCLPASYWKAVRY